MIRAWANRREGYTGDVVPCFLDRAAQSRRPRAWGEAGKETGRERDAE